MLKNGGEERSDCRQTFIKQQFELLVKPLLHSLSKLVNENSRFCFSLTFRLWVI